MKNSVFIILMICLTTSFLSAQKIDDTFFNKVDLFMKENVKEGLIEYTSLKRNRDLNELVTLIEMADITTLDEESTKAFYINAYNILVIDQIRKLYPIRSVYNTAGFFDKQKFIVAGSKMTLNKIEKNKLVKTYNDARFHFVLVCGALGCPPITDFAYKPTQLDAQLDQQTRLSLNDPNFIQVNDQKTGLSEIFKWYAPDFGGSKNLVDFINQYRTEPISQDTKITYYNYDWSLNEVSPIQQIDYNGDPNANNANRYVVSSTIQKGNTEFKIFNNLYSQQTGSNNNLDSRSSFFTTAVSALYGLTNRFNIGINTRYRKVRNNALPSSPFSVFGSDLPSNSRSGITAFGPQIRYAPNPKWKNFSIQSSFVFAIGSDLAGSNTQPYIDWSGPTWQTQFFNDFSIGTKFSLFTEIDLLLEDIGSSSNGHVNRLSTPVTVILSYNPTPKSTLYALSGYSPFWQIEYDYFAQAGIGAKYQITSRFELETLYTYFTNKFLQETNGKAQTINLGIRFNL